MICGNHLTRGEQRWEQMGCQALTLSLSTTPSQGVSWYYWKGFDFSVPFTEMKLRPRSYRPPGRGG